MLFQATNIIPDTRTGIGFGVIDTTQGMQVSWQVNGDYPVMTAFRIIIYANDTASTQLYDTGRLTTGCPFSGRDAKGEIRFFAYSIAAATLSTAGISNGNEYKYTITQYYMEGGAETSITQSSASVFITRSAPSFTMTSPNVTTAEYTFTWSYSQAQRDTVEWLRYQLRLIGTNLTTMIYDSGNVYGLSVYQFTYSGLINGQQYEVRALGQTSSGVQMSTPWTAFIPNYTVTFVGGIVMPRVAPKYNAIQVSWPGATTTTGQDSWVLYRKQGTNTAMQKIGEFPTTTRIVYDFGAGNGQGPFSYYLFAAVAANPSATPPTPTQYLSYAIVSQKVWPKSYCWSLLDTVEDADGAFRVVQEFDFKLNLDSGSMSNNNSPNVLHNFTTMPTVQSAPSNYKSGSLTSLLGSASAGEYEGDTMALRNALMALSTTNDTLFLKSSKGDVLTVRINGPITAAMVDVVSKQPQTVSVPWVEVDDTPANIIAYVNDPVFYQ